MLDRIYLEITNVCNLDCSFCHKTKREKKLLSSEEFDLLLGKISGKGKHLFFHLMGEPTLHPSLPEFIKKARQGGFLPCVTTNGSLLSKSGDALIEAEPYKVSVSLHAPEANSAFSDKAYLENCIEFAKKAATRGCFVALRLWNLGSNADNTDVLDFLHKEFPNEWTKRRNGESYRLDTRIFLEWGERFEWPDPNLPEADLAADLFCYALREQVGILVDGTVVPCCLDHAGAIPLGNLFEQSLDEVIASPRACAIYDGFTRHVAVEPLCRRCGYAAVIKKLLVRGKE